MYLGKMTGIFSKASQKAQQQPSSHHPPKLSFVQIPDFLNIFRIIEFCAHLVGYWDSWKSMSLLCDVEMSLGGVTCESQSCRQKFAPQLHFLSLTQVTECHRFPFCSLTIRMGDFLQYPVKATLFC